MNLYGQDAVAAGEARQSLKPYCQRSFQTDQYVQQDILNPCTVELLKSLPSLSTERGVRLEEIAGVVPDFADMPPSCRFHPRCPHAFDKLRGQARARAVREPPLQQKRASFLAMTVFDGSARRIHFWLSVLRTHAGDSPSRGE